jgi:hypothetical protein
VAFPPGLLVGCGVGGGGLVFPVICGFSAAPIFGAPPPPPLKPQPKAPFSLLTQQAGKPHTQPPRHGSL